MFKKTKQAIDTPLDKAIQSKWKEIFSANDHIRARAEKVIIRSLAISCYAENTPDWSKARDDLATAKHSLLCAIGIYDNLIAEATRLLKQEGERVTTTYWAIDRLSTSHEIVENVCRNFYKNR